jgi:UDP-2,3-diacylglucosamine pyrophosphatase LpxH/glycosyltransferase involved in cell wall biosynthesis
MKADIVTDTFAPDVNGVAMTLGRLTNALITRGHRIRVIRSGEKSASGEAAIASIPLPGYKEVRIGMPGPFKLRKRWIKRRPDVIYVATESPLGISAVSVAKTLGIPVITGFHTNFHQYLSKYRLGLLQPAAMSYLRHIHSRADVTLAPSIEVVKMLEDEGIFHARLLGRGVDTELFDPQYRDDQLRSAWGAKQETCVYLTVGRVAAEKNLTLAIQAMENVRLMAPDAQFVIVGDGPLRENLQKTYPWIHFSGMQQGEDLARHYASADVLLFPSVTETFGNVVLEGLASGLMVVGFDYAASAQHIEHDVNGLKAKMNDEEHWIKLACDARIHPQQQNIRSAARHSIMEQSWDVIADQFEEILARAARNNSPLIDNRGGKIKPEKYQCRTVFLSDIHLGTPESKAEEVVTFLKMIQCEKLVLNGDIIDGWALRRGTRWSNKHSRVIRTILKKMEKQAVEVIYLRGNHDDILERFLPLTFGSMKIVKEHIHYCEDGKKYLVVHGDGFDSVATNHRWIAMMGAFGYDSLLKINRLYNKWRAFRGKEYYSLSKAVKGRVKSAVSFVDKYEEQLQKLARQKNCTGIICGHIHTPADKMLDGIHYLNSGDWVESMSAVIEELDGSMNVIYFKDFLQKMGDQALSDNQKEISAIYAQEPVMA